MGSAALAPGQRFGSYEILGDLGAGGMGRVYRAKDLRLGRLVALKFLQVHLEGDLYTVGRFQREAHLLASMHHPGIAAIYGLEDADGVPVLAMELVEGPTLAERLKQGRITVDDAMRMAKQIAEALQSAHQKGVVHRDLKPANVKIAPDGSVKLLDFGLATMLEGEPAEAASRAVTRTDDGTVVGTYAYMSPEQADGRKVDTRTDIWAFGAIFYEMLSGKRLTDGPTLSATVAALFTRDPDWSRLPSDTPMGVRSLLQRCLEKDPDARLADISEAPMAIRCCMTCRAGAWPLVNPSAVGARGPAKARPWGVAAVAFAALGIAVVGWQRAGPTAASAPLLRLTAELGPTAASDSASTPDPALAPDGARIVFVTTGQDGKPRLSTRDLAEDLTAELARTENAHDPFFSPDGRWIAFFADGKLKKIPVHGGSVQELCDAPDGRGGAWGENGQIIFAPSTRAGLYRVPADGGTPQPATTLDTAKREKTHRWPQFLPGSNTVLFTVHSMLGNFGDGSIEAQSLASGRRVVLQTGAYFGRYCSSGHLLFVRDGAVYAVTMHPRTLQTSGSPVAAADGIATDPGTGAAQFDVSRNGTLVYREGRASGATWSIEWMDRAGRVTPLLPESLPLLGLRLSPDQKSVAMSVLGKTGYDVWVYDLERRQMKRVTFSAGFNGYPVWTPDGSKLAIESDRDGVGNLYLIRADGSAEPERLTRVKNSQSPGSFSPDGKLLAFSEWNPENESYDIWTMPVDTKSGRPEVFAATPANESAPAFSPDGQWIAYESNESGTQEVYVRRFPRGGGKWQISMGGGSTPVWSRSEPALVFKTPDRRIMAAPYAARGESFVSERPKPWSQRPIPLSRIGADFDLAPDGARIAVQALRQPEGQPANALAHFLLNFSDELRRRSAAGR